VSALRRFWFGLSTLLGRPRGFFVPYRHAEGVEAPGAYAELANLFAASHAAFDLGLAGIARHRETLLAFGNEAPPAPRWQQDWFPGLDAAYAYALVRDTKPKRIVEIGSGHSTRFLARAIKDGGLATKLVAIDLAPRAALAGLDVVWLRQRLETSGFSFAELQAGDILFVDSSHILMPGTDVDFVLGRVLPALPAGVRIHFHDIFLPHPYPADWAWRGYNEQNAVAGLLAGTGFALEWGSAYVRQAMAAEKFDMPPGALESSLWLVKR
jgi:hypothetical protein